MPPFFPTALPIGTIGDLLAGCTSMLESEGVPDAQREAREIVAAVLDVPKFWAAANAVADASPQVARSVIRAAMRRASGMPLAYAVGRASFRHISLEVDERVLIPRVETEVLVDRVLERCTPRRASSPTSERGRAPSRSRSRSRRSSIALSPPTYRSTPSRRVRQREVFSSALKSPVEFRNGALLCRFAASVRCDRLQPAVHQLRRDRGPARGCS
jgi:release factor glutamine methyltransferase